MKNSSKKKRIQKIINTVMRVASGDYSVQNELLGKNDELDALAMGLNMMIDDLRNNEHLEKQNKKITAINEKLEQAKEKAQESDRLKSAFLANLSHEIRTPINAIMGFSSVLRRYKNSPEQTEKYLAYIENAGKHLLELINDIIDLSKIDSDQLKINIQLYSLNNLLDLVAEILKEDKKLESKPGLNLIFNYDSQQDICFINTDEVRFKQIFINLINNAIKFTEKGYVEIGYSFVKEQNNDSVKIYVKDTGIGIPEDLQNIIFKRFWQAHSDQFHEGTGLGLSITKGLIDKLGGKICVESKNNEGTTFYVSFPCQLKK